MTLADVRILRRTWDQRDVRYGTGRGLVLTDAQVEAVRAWRATEAVRVGAPGPMIAEAWAWEPPAVMPYGRIR